MVPRLIAVDMDGTLLSSDGRVSVRNRAAIAAANAQGIEVVIATGRRHCYAMAPLRGVGLCKEHALISSNGTVIRSVGAELLHRTHMPVKTAKWLCEYATEFRSTMVMTFDTVLPNGDDTLGALVCERVHDLNGSIGKWMEANGAYIEYVDKLEEKLTGEPPIQMMMCGTSKLMNQAIDKLLLSPKVTKWGEDETPETEIVLHKTEYTEKDLLILDILPAGCSKASALARLAEIRGCTMEETMAIGDNWNDLPMLEFAGQAVVMANAPEPLHGFAAARGWTVAPENDADGVAWAIERVLEPVEA